MIVASAAKGTIRSFGEVVEHGSGYSAVRVLNKVDKLMAGSRRMPS